MPMLFVLTGRSYGRKDGRTDIRMDGSITRFRGHKNDFHPSLQFYNHYSDKARLVNKVNLAY